MHATVQSQDGKTLGHIRDFTVDPQQGRIEFAILSLSPSASSSSTSSGTSSSSSLGGTSASTSSTTPNSGVADTSTSGRETVPSSRSSVGGVTGSSPSYAMTGKLIPVPWQLFSQSLNSSQIGSSSSASTTSSSMPTLVVNLDESKLQSAPSFDASSWTELQQGTLDQQVYSHFGVSRNSGAGTSGSSISGQGTGSRDSSGNRDSSGAKGGGTDLNK